MFAQSKENKLAGALRLDAVPLLKNLLGIWENRPISTAMDATLPPR
jgi:hypothetical protein